MSALRELLASFEVEVKDDKLDSAHEKIEKVVEKLKEFGEALAGGYIVEKIREFTNEQIEAGAALSHTAERLGLSTEELQKFQYAASLAGVSGESAAHSLRFLNKSIGEAVTGGGDAASTWASMGISLKDGGGKVKDLSEVLPQLADHFQGLGSAQEQTALAMKLFGREGAAMVPILKNGGKGIEELYGEFQELGGGMSEEFTKKAKEAEDQTIKMKLAFTSLKSIIALGLIPGVVDFTNKMKNLAVSAIELFRNTNALWLAVNALKVLMGYAAYTAVMKLASALGLVGIEGVLITAGLVILGLILEDLYTLFTGGDSIIGEWIDNMFGVGASAEFVDTVKKSMEGLSEFMSGPLLEATIQFGKDVVMVFRWAAFFAENFADNVNDAYNAVAGLIGLQKTAEKKGQNLTPDEVDAKKAEQKKYQQNILNSIPGVSQSNTAPAIFIPGVTKAGSVQQTNQTTINVSGVSDPHKAGTTAAEKLRSTVGDKSMDAFNALTTTGGE